jgi:hypothetical protein
MAIHIGTLPDRLSVFGLVCRDEMDSKEKLITALNAAIVNLKKEVLEATGQKAEFKQRTEPV